jgi:hypothetical protein
LQSLQGCDTVGCDNKLRLLLLELFEVGDEGFDGVRVVSASV